ncbi:hypothetical protein QBC40DRAFT_313890 [Triangularia verruculosa]|uniref:Uncharacterized protein n=1 Tax=Triangularia verruculosa TaxID=2587418 RepID=A0AAN7APF5_9PEZI|nr:hypothetical protein QBC40DRAFT_313890 [Triangularia verruculosa]
MVVSSHISALLAAAILFNVRACHLGNRIWPPPGNLLGCPGSLWNGDRISDHLVAPHEVASHHRSNSGHRWPVLFDQHGERLAKVGVHALSRVRIKQQEQVVATSTLILWRSTSIILGVACSSIVVQDSLWYYLQEFVNGPEKDTVIVKVRKSVEAIRDLEGLYQEQVVQSYAAALRLSFLCCFILAIVNFCLVTPVKLGRLGSKRVCCQG